MKKVCTKCKKEKQLSEFAKKIDTKDGLTLSCKECNNISIKKYFRSKKGLITKIYNSQIRHSKKREYNLPNYTLEELREWVLGQPNFEQLYLDWVKSEYNKNLTPSCDRNNDYKPYSLDILTMMTWQDNRKKYHSDRKRGVNDKALKAVIQSTLDGIFIKEFYSAAEADRKTGVSFSGISSCCTKRPIKKGLNKDGSIRYSVTKSAGGFTWKYKSND